MNITKGLIIALITVTSALPVFAGIMDELDNMTPQEAAQFREKLDDKADDAFMLNNGGTGFVQFVNPKELNKAFGLKDIRSIYGGVFNYRVPVNKQFYIGGDFGGAGSFTTRETAANVYEDLYVGYGSAQFILDYHLVKEKSFKLNTTAGVGLMYGGYNYFKTDENTQTSYNTYRTGLGLCSSVGINALWQCEDGWSAGIGAGYFWGKIDSSSRIFHSADKNAPEMDFSGLSIRVSGRKYF